MDVRKSFKRFMLVNCSQSVSLIGSALTDFAMSYYLLSATMQNDGGISQYTLLYFFMYLPGILIAPFIGPLVDRFNKKYIIMGSDTVAILGSLSVWLLYANGMLRVFHIYLVVLVKAVASACQTPAFQAGISELVDEKDYGKAVGFAQVGESINKIVSPILGGVLYFSTSMETIIAIDFLCYLFATLLMAACRFENTSRTQEMQGLSFLQECKLGFQLLVRDKLMISLLLLFVFNNFFTSFIQILVQPLVYVMNEQAGMVMSNSLALGVVLTCGGIGMMVSSIVIGFRGLPGNRIATILGLNACGGFILMLVIAVKSVAIFAGGTLLYFLTIPYILSSNITIWQERIPKEHQGKVFSIRRASVLGIIPLSSLLAGWLGDTMQQQYATSPLLQKLTGSADGIYALLFFAIGVVTVLISIVFGFNRNFKTEMTGPKGGG